MKISTQNKNQQNKRRRKTFFYTETFTNPGVLFLTALLCMISLGGTSKMEAQVFTNTAIPVFSQLTATSTNTFNLLAIPQTATSSIAHLGTSTILDLLNINKIKAPEIVAKGAAVYDISDKEFIYSKDAEESLPMASLVKILTATVFLDINKLREKQGNSIGNISIIKKNIGYNAGDRSLINKEVWRSDNLIKYMLITSSNIAAESLASSIVDDEFSFSLLMNKTVKDLGYKSFSFKNSSGLPIANPDYDAKDASSSKLISSSFGNAKEIAVLYNTLFLNYPFLGSASIIPEATFLNWSGNTHDTKNVNASLSQIPNIIAGKTGTTDEAGGNLIIIIEANKKKYVIVILGSTIEDRYSDTLKLASSTEAFAALK